MSVRTEQTLRDMWEAGARRAAEASQHHNDANQCVAAAEAHERAAAEAKAAVAAEEQAAKSARTAAQAKFALAEGRAAEAADLADLVNRERTDAGLAPLAAGEPYPADPAPAGQPTVEDTLVASAQSAVETRVDRQEAGS
jgi:hypothetical protein